MNRRSFLGGVSAAITLALAKVGIVGAAECIPEEGLDDIAGGAGRQYWCSGRDCSGCTWRGKRTVQRNWDFHYDSGWTATVIDEDYEAELKAICEHSTIDMPKALIVHRSDGQVTIMLHDRRPVWITISKDGVSRFAAGGVEELPPTDQYAQFVRAT